MADIDFGTDLDFDGLDISETGGTVSGIELLRQIVVIRLSNGRSQLGAEDDGIDLAAELSRGMTTADVVMLGARIERELLKDERFSVVRANVDSSRLAATGELDITLSIDTEAGPFDLVLTASAAGVAIAGGE